MATKNTKKINKWLSVENAIDTVELVNTVALTSTETAFNKGFKAVEKLQNATDKYLKLGFKFSTKQHDVVFDTLENSKEKTVKKFKKVAKRFNKKSA